MDEDQAKVTVKVQTNAYPACIKPAEALVPYIAQFDMDSASRAIFCINSWAANRSFQNSAYALNAAILSIDHFGTKKLTSYKSFLEFFSAIQDILPIFPYEDEVIPVMGHTMIPFQEKWRKVISGCGVTLEYPRLYFADSIIREPDKVEEFGTLLDYIDDMATSLNGGEWREVDEPLSELGLPSQEYWERVSAWMDRDPGSALRPDTVRSIDSQATYVENKAFLLHDNQAIPLFCPSLLEDYLNHHIENSSVETIQSRLDAALIEHARLIYDTDGRMGGSVFTYPIFEVGSELIEQCPAIFLVFNGKNGLTLFYNASMRFNDDGLLKLKHHFQEKEAPLTIVDYAITQGKHRKLVLKNPSKCSLTIVAYHDNVYLSPSFIGFEERAKNADVECGAADLMAIILMGREIDEICSFFQASARTRNQIPFDFSSSSDRFSLWLATNRHIISGTEDRHAKLLLSFDFNETDRYFSDYFQTKLINYPQDNTGAMRLGPPFAYRFEHNDRGFTEIILKSSGQTCGLLKRLAATNRQHPSYLHLYADVESARDVPIGKFEQEAELFPVFQDLLMSMTNSIEIELGNIVSNWGYLALVYVMPGGSSANNLQILDEELGIKGRVFGTSHPIIMYSVDSELFCASQAKVQDRSVECRFIVALLSLIETKESSISEILTPKLEELASEKKMVNSNSFVLPYRWHQGLMITIDDTSKASALQTVAYAMDDSGIEPGEYYGKDANKVIRESQAALTKAFEHELSQFSKNDLLIKLYEALASFSHTFFLDTMRYALLSDLQEKEKARVKEGTLDERENARRNLRTAMFSIETLLALGGEGTTIARKEDVARLLAIGEQLLSSSDAADMLLFEPKGMGIEVAHNHVATTIEVEDLVSETRNIKQRQILDHGHAGSSYTEDKLFIERAKASFEADTEIPFDSFIDVLDVLSLDCLDYSNDSHVSPNVISANKSRMVEELSQSLNGGPDTQMSERCLDFLTLDVGALKQIGGKQLDYLPFGRVKDRPNRLELKPLLALDDQLVYSPVQVGMLKRRWLHGIMDRFLPAKVAFPKLNSTIEDWKRRYEKTLETDVEDCFISNGFARKDVYRGLELCKKGNHPQYLGDYDGLAYDASSATIWVVECKEYEKVESAYDYMQLQQRWFGQDGKLLKFERRIKYMQDHLEEIANDLGLAHQDPLQLRPYLVSNKIFTNLIGDSNFQVITLSELNELLSRRTC